MAWSGHRLRQARRDATKKDAGWKSFDCAQNKPGLQQKSGPCRPTMLFPPTQEEPDTGTLSSLSNS